MYIADTLSHAHLADISTCEFSRDLEGVDHTQSGKSYYTRKCKGLQRIQCLRFFGRPSSMAGQKEKLKCLSVGMSW